MVGTSGMVPARNKAFVEKEKKKKKKKERKKRYIIIKENSKMLSGYKG